MSAAYELCLTTGTVDDARELLSAVFGLPFEGEDWELPNCVMSGYAPDADDREAVREEIDLDPVVIVRFNYASSQAALAEVRRASEALALHFLGDAALVFNGDQVIWERRGSAAEWKRQNWARVTDDFAARQG